MITTTRPPRRTRWLLAPVLAVAAPATVDAQAIPQLLPFSQTADLFVADSTNDNIWRMQDLNLDGDYNDAGEVIEFYSDLIGAIPLSNNVGVAFAPNGLLYVCDSSQDIVLALLDRDGDGDANDNGEHWVWFDGSAAGTYGGNGSGVVLNSAQDLTVDAQGVVWAASAATATGTNDAVIRLEDLGGTPGANDPGEAAEYVTFTPSVTLGNAVPNDVLVGPGGFIYLLDGDATAFVQKGIYRLHDDVVANGNCNDPGEVSPFFIPPALANTPFFWGMTIDASGAFYMADSTNEVVWRAQDVNGNNVIDPGEEVLWWSPQNTSSLIWRTAAAEDGSVYCAESQAPDRILRMSDDNLNGNVNDPGEVVAVYDDTVSSVVVGNPRSLAFARGATLETDPTPSIGATTDVTIRARDTDYVVVFYSTFRAIPPIIAPPYGELELAFNAPGAIVGLLYGAAITASGEHVMSFPIPNDPRLVSFGLLLQGLAGNGVRLQFTNSAGLVIQ